MYYACIYSETYYIVIVVILGPLIYHKYIAFRDQSNFRLHIRRFYFIFNSVVPLVLNNVTHIQYT